MTKEFTLLGFFHILWRPISSNKCWKVFGKQFLILFCWYIFTS